MSEPFLGQLGLFSFGFAPRGWAMANGQLLPINLNQALFALLGTTYGGNGQTNFALPDLRGRTPMHRGAGFLQGQVVGEEAHTLLQAEMPTHAHVAQASSSSGDQPVPKILAAANNLYAPASALTAIEPSTISTVGGSQPHPNRDPFLVLSWCIALQGIFPSQN